MRWGLVLALAFLLLWDPLWRLAGVGQMPPWRLKTLLRGGAPARIVDVRTAAEFRLFHIPGAEHRPDLLHDAAARAELLRQTPADSPIVVVCMTGHRSPPVVCGLADPRARNLTGGMLGWLLLGGPIQ